MANQKDEPIPEVESEAEPEPEPEPPKRGAKTRGGKKTNGVASSPLHEKRKAAEQTKALTPAKTPKGTTKGKAKLNGDVASSSPVANGTGATRRSGRTRS